MKMTKRQIYFRILTFKLKTLLNRPKSFPGFVLDYISRTFPKTRKNVIVSYPKSGRTWLEQLLIQVALENFEIKENYIEHFNELRKINNDAPYVLLTHANSSWEDLIILDENEIQKVDKQSQAGEKTVFLCRDPRDVLVSSYYHLQYRNGINWISPTGMIENPVVGLPKIICFMNEWLNYTQNHQNCIMVSYENLQSEPIKSLEQVCEHFDFNTEEKTLKKAIENCSFTAMQRKEKKQALRSQRLRTFNNKQPESRKVRSGKVGNHINFFSEVELGKIDEIISAELNPVFGYHSK